MASYKDPSEKSKPAREARLGREVKPVKAKVAPKQPDAKTAPVVITDWASI